MGKLGKAIIYFIFAVFFILLVKYVIWPELKVVYHNLKEKTEQKKAGKRKSSYYEKTIIFEGPITEAMSFDDLSKEAHIKSIGRINVSYIKDSDGDWIKIPYKGANTFKENKPVPAPARRPSSTLIVEPQGDTAIIQVIDVKY